MSNKEILTYEKLLAGINEDIYTYAELKKRGYQVKKGEKAIINTQIWKNTTYTDKKTGEEKTKMIMVKGSFFTINQCELIQK